jgi:hypothetical protein
MLRESGATEAFLLELDLISKDVGLFEFMKSIGWFPGRKVDLSADLQAWSEYGYEVFDTVREFMTECSKLKFAYPMHPAVGGMHSCLVSGAISSRRIARSLISEHEERVGSGLCPIGQSASGNMFLLMAASGTTYGVHDRFLARIADDGYHALHIIWTKGKLVEL